MTNSANSSGPALNIAPSPDDQLTANNCPGSLAVGASCTMDFHAAATAVSETVIIQGSNTNSTTLTINTFLEPILTVNPIVGTPTISISAANFTVTNNAIPGAAVATNVNMTLPASWTNAQAFPSPGCANLAPGSSNCEIVVSSTTPYVAQGQIVVSGDNTAQTPQVTSYGQNYVAIGYLYFPNGISQPGGYVFDTSAGVTVAYTSDNSPGASWQTGTYALVGATSASDGAFNTQRMLSDPLIAPSPAATTCNELPSGSWYVPAADQLLSMYSFLAGLGIGGFTTSNYWSSTEVSITNADYVNFQNGVLGNDDKSLQQAVRCATTL